MSNSTANALDGIATLLDRGALSKAAAATWLRKLAAAIRQEVK